MIALLLPFLSIAMSTSSPLEDPLAAPKTAIFIHGAGGGGWEWKAWTPVFEKAGWKCIAEDLQPVSAGIEHTRFSDYLAQVVHQGSRRGKGKLVLVGASMGGILALKSSDRLKPDAVVLVNSVGPAGVGQRKSKAYPKVVEWSKGTLKETQDSMPDSDDATIQFAFHRWRDESGAVLGEISSGIRVETPTCPLLVIIGDRDTDVPNAVGVAMAQKYHGELKSFPGMSHVGPLLGTRATEVANWTIEWLNKHVR